MPLRPREGNACLLDVDPGFLMQEACGARPSIRSTGYPFNVQDDMLAVYARRGREYQLSMPGFRARSPPLPTNETNDGTTFFQA